MQNAQQPGIAPAAQSTTPSVPEAHAAQAPAPQGGGQAGIVPSPRNVVTGRTKFSAEISALVADQSITPFHNNRMYPLHPVHLNAHALHVLFRNLLDPLIRPFYRFIGARNLTDQTELQIIDDVIRSVAKDALYALHACAYNGAISVSAMMAQQFGATPQVAGTEFPISLVVIINSTGPITIGETAPFRGTYVPHLSLAEIDAVPMRAGGNYMPQAYNLFLEAARKSKSMSLAHIDVHAKAPSPWWTQDVHYPDPSDVTQITVYSPIPWEQTDHVTKVAMLFANSNVAPPIGFQFQVGPIGCPIGTLPSQVSTWIQANNFIPENAPAYHVAVQLNENDAEVNPVHVIAPQIQGQTGRRRNRDEAEEIPEMIAEVTIYLYDCIPTLHMGVTRRGPISTRINSV
jgi:hypothetical protein